LLSFDQESLPSQDMGVDQFAAYPVVERTTCIIVAPKSLILVNYTISNLQCPLCE
jgi:hypothetical protein